MMLLNPPTAAATPIRKSLRGRLHLGNFVSTSKFVKWCGIFIFKFLNRSILHIHLVQEEID